MEPRLSHLAGTHRDIFVGTALSRDGAYIEVFTKVGHGAEATDVIKAAEITPQDRVVIIEVPHSDLELDAMQAALSPDWQRRSITASGPSPAWGGLAVAVATTASLSPQTERELRDRGVVCIHHGDGGVAAAER
ncbi:MULTISPECIES: hypothetical protein [unclassified Luteococcus]|uniref:hypothetical protein n=1 Tax=unclassified Luteococcus TaxID=2639923 RepID=UPI00313C573C